MKFNGYLPKEAKQYTAHLSYQLGIVWSIASKIAENEKVFTAMNEAHIKQDSESYDKAFELLKEIKGIGSYRAGVYLEKYFENPYRTINWAMFKLLQRYQEATGWSDNRMYDIARKVDDPSQIWWVHLNDDSITLPIAREIYSMTTKDSEALQNETIQYFSQHLDLRIDQNNNNRLTTPKFLFNEDLNEEYKLFLEVSNHVMLRKTAEDYMTVLNYMRENKDEEIVFEQNDEVDVSTFGEDQKEAYEVIKNKKVVMITGYAGTGKTYMLDKFIESLSGRTVYACALAGKAVKNFSLALGEQARYKTNYSTIAGLRFVGRNRDLLESASVVLVDESSMMSLSDLAFIIKNLNDKKKLILVGDINQLPAIELDVMNWLVSDGEIDLVKLDIPKRQMSNSGIFKDSMSIINFKETGVVPEFNTEESQVNIGPTTIQQIVSENRDADIFLTGTNRVKDVINEIMCKEVREVPNHKIFEAYAYKKELEFHEGEKVMVGANNADTGLMNGDIFVINYDGYLCDPVTAIPARDLDGNLILIGKKRGKSKDVFNSDKEIDIAAHKMSYAFAITTHKSQGSTLDKGVTIMGPGPLAINNLLYTALTRFKTKHTLYVPDEDCLYSILKTGVSYQKLNEEQQNIISESLGGNDDGEEDEV